MKLRKIQKNTNNAIKSEKKNQNEKFNGDRYHEKEPKINL